MQVDASSTYKSYAFNIKASLTTTSGDDLQTDENGLTDETKEKIKNGQLSAKSLSNSYLLEFSLTIESYSNTSFGAQSSTFDINKIKDLTQNLDLDKLGYTGKPIADLTQD